MSINSKLNLKVALKSQISSFPPLFIVGTSLSGRKSIAKYIENKYDPFFRICKQFTSDVNLVKQNSNFYVY